MQVIVPNGPDSHQFHKLGGNGMGKQLIISVGREFGSGGHVIAEELAGRFDLPLYDNNLLAKFVMSLIAGIF